MGRARRPGAATIAPPRRGEAPKRGLAPHLEGWQPALLGVLLAGSTALVVVPRPVEPREIPEPRVDGRALGRTLREDEALAQSADEHRLDVDVLNLGTALFSYGEVDAG